MQTEANKTANRGRKGRPTQAQRREHSMSRIMTASLTLLAENGYDRFSLQDVGNLAGCSYELVNHYFGNKPGLISEMVKHIITHFDNITEQIGDTPPGFERLAGFIRLFTAPANKPSLEFTCYLRLWAEAPYDPMLSKIFKKRVEQTIALLEEAIVSGQQAGEITAGVDAKPLAITIYKYIRGHADVLALFPMRKSAKRANGAMATDTAELFIESLRCSYRA